MTSQNPRGPAASEGSRRIFYLILLVVVLGGGGWLLFGGRGGGGDTSAALVSLPELEDIVADPESGVALGPADAPVTIAEFADFSCPYCAQFGTFTGRLIRQNYVENGEGVRWVQYDYVLGHFPHSVAAAASAHCAGDQGRFWLMHDLLLARQREWATASSPDFRVYAREAGLDVGEFGRCLDEGRHMERIMSARKYGDELGVSQTPTLFLNGRLLDNVGGETSYAALERLITSALDSVRSDGGP